MPSAAVQRVQAATTPEAKHAAIQANRAGTAGITAAKTTTAPSPVQIPTSQSVYTSQSAQTKMDDLTAKYKNPPASALAGYVNPEGTKGRAADRKIVDVAQQPKNMQYVNGQLTDTNQQTGTSETSGVQMTPEQTDLQTNINNSNAQIDEEHSGLMNTLDDLISDLDDTYMADRIQSVKNEFDKLRTAQEQANNFAMGAMKQAGNRSGRSRYAPEIQTGLITQTTQNGIDRMAEIQSREDAAVEAAKDAIDEKRLGYAMKMDDLVSKIKEEKRVAANDLKAEIKAQTDLQIQKNKEAREQIKFQQDTDTYERKTMLEDTGVIAGNLIGQDAQGNIQMPSSEQIQQIAEDMGIDPNYLMSAVRTKAQELSKLSQEDLKRELDIMKIQKDLKEEKMSTMRSDYERALANGEFDGTYLDYIAAEEEAKASGEKAGKGGVGTTYTDPLSNSIAGAVNRLRLPAAAKADAVADVNSYLERGDIEGAKESLKIAIRNSADVETGKIVDKKDLSVASLERLQGKMDAFEKSGGDTGFFTGLSESALQKIGTTRGVGKLAELKNDIALAIIDYRQAVSGAAFTKEEGIAYEAVFPSIGKVPLLNKVKIDSLVGKFKSDIERFNMQRVGESTYKSIFGDSEASAPRDYDTEIESLISSHPEVSEQAIQLSGGINEETGQPYSSEEIWQIIGGDDLLNYEYEPAGPDWSQGGYNWNPGSGKTNVGGDTDQASSGSLISKAFNSLIPGAHASEPVITERDVQIYESQHGAPTSSPTTILDGLKVITKNLAPNLQKFADNCVFFARQIVSNIPTGATSVAGRKEGIKVAERAGYGGSDLSKARIGDALHTTEGNVGHTAVIVGESGDNWILKEANYKSGQISEGRQISKNDPKLLGWIRPGKGSVSNQKNEGKNQSIESQVQKIARKSPVFKSYYFSS